MAEQEVIPAFELDGETPIRRNPEIVFTQIDGETVMMDAAFENYLGMAKVGSRIWDFLEQETTITELIAKLMEQFEVDEETCRAEVLAFLGKLQENELLQVGPDTKS